MPTVISEMFETKYLLLSDNACVRVCRVKLSFRKINGNRRKCVHRTRACDKRQKRQLPTSDKILNFYNFTRAL